MEELSFGIVQVGKGEVEEVEEVEEMEKVEDVEEVEKMGDLK